MPYSPKRRIELDKKVNWWGIFLIAIATFLASIFAGKWIGQALLGSRKGVKLPPAAVFTPTPLSSENANSTGEAPKQNVSPPALVVPPPVVEPTESSPAPEEEASPSPTQDKEKNPPSAVGPRIPASSRVYKVQVGVFSDRANADDLVSELSQQAYSANVEKISQGNQTIYRVYLGPYGSRVDAKSAVDGLTSTGYSAFILEEPR